MKMKAMGWLVVVLLAACGGCSNKPPVDDVSKLEGEWKVLELNEKGKRIEEQKAKRLNYIFNNGHCQKVEINDTAQQTQIIASKTGNTEFAIRVDNSKTPAEIDFVGLKGAEQGKTQMGIFLLEDTKLTLCVADLGAPRPTDFAAKPASTFVILERKQ